MKTLAAPLFALILAVAAFAGPPFHEWRQVKDAPTQKALYRDGVQIGGYDTARDIYRPYDAKKDEWGPPGPCPIASPGSRNYGVDKTRLQKKERYLVNGKESTKQQVEQILAREVPDDSSKYRITVIGATDEDRAQVAVDLASHPSLAFWKDRTIQQSFPPGHWKVVRDRFVSTGAPTIYFQAPSGEVLHRQDDYKGGAPALAAALQKADPRYRPEDDKDLRIVKAVSFPRIPWSAPAMVAAALGLHLWSRRK